MKTLEEEALEALEEIKATEVTIETFCYRNGWGHYPLKKLLADFARQAIHQALEGAAEKAQLKITSQSEDFSTTASVRCDGANLITVDKPSILSLKEKYQ